MLLGTPNCRIDATVHRAFGIPYGPDASLYAIVGRRMSCQLEALPHSTFAIQALSCRPTEPP